MSMATTKIWKVRMRKTYSDETNHVVIGEVLEENPLYLKMRCRVLHFKRPTMKTHVTMSDTKVRIFPWATISYGTEHPDSPDWERATVGLDEKGDVVLEPAGNSQGINLKEGLDN
jgi:hypothetical protein